MSNSIVILKQIIDLLYEDHLKNETEYNATKTQLTEKEMQLNQKEKEVETLFTENVKLSNLLSKYESDIELLANIISEKPKVSKTETQETPKETPPPSPPKVCSRTVIIEKTPSPKGDAAATSGCTTPEETPEIQKETPTMQEEATKKKPRTDYMREYQREYRKKKREEKISMNV